jgi:hypothetical protein
VSEYWRHSFSALVLIGAPLCKAQQKRKKCDEQVKIRDEQARGAKMEGKMSADFLDRRTGFSGFTGVGKKAFDLA